MLDFNHASGATPGRDPLERAPIGDLINERIDAALVRVRQAQPPRAYLGASVLGDPCARKIAYDYRHERGEPFTGQALRIFDAGHLFENLAVEWLRRAGFDLRSIDPRTGRQYEFQTAGGKIQGHVDGIIVAGPSLGFRYPVLWENKSLNHRSWTDLVKHGLAASKEIYHGQVQVSMGYLELHACLFTALNKNTCELYHQLVPLVLSEAQRLSDRALDIVRAVEAGQLPPRIASSSDFYLCRWCRFHDTCWSSQA